MNKYEAIGLALEFTRYLAKHAEAREQLLSFYPGGSESLRGDEEAARLVTDALQLDPPLTLSDLVDFKMGMRIVHSSEAPHPGWLTLQMLAAYHSGGGHI